MATTTQSVGQSPFNPVRSFMAVATGDERVTLKDPAMFDLQLAIDTSRKLNETLLCAKGARISGGDAAPILADAVSRLTDLANAMDHFADPIDDAAMASVEHREAAE